MEGSFFNERERKLNVRLPRVEKEAATKFQIENEITWAAGGEPNGLRASIWPRIRALLVRSG